jgi:uncharacterized protein YerC
MPKVSKHPLPKDDEAILFAQLAKLFSKKSSLETQDILGDLLGYEEKLMLAKRFAIITLIWKRQTIYSIAQKLHVSTSTVDRILDNYNRNSYSNITQALDKPSNAILEILNTIDNVLHLGGILPHYGQTHATEAYKEAIERKRRNTR